MDYFHQDVLLGPPFIARRHRTVDGLFGIADLNTDFDSRGFNVKSKPS